jgi:hypothetical protein
MPAWNLFEIIAFSSERIVGKARLNLSIELPDLKIASLTYGKPSKGSWLNMNVTFVNDAKVSTGNVEIVLLVDGKFVASDKIAILPAYSYHMAVLSWLAQGGKHEIIIRLDPSNNINESNESNNELKEIIDVKSSENAQIDYLGLGLGLGSGLVIFCVILLAVIMCIGSFTLYLKIKRPKKIEKQEDLSAFTFSSGQTVEELRKAYEEGRIQKPKIDEEAEADLREYDEMTRTKPKLESENETENEEIIEKNKEQEENKESKEKTETAKKEDKKEVERKQEEKEDKIIDEDEKTKTELRSKN